jgi:glycosyltransferase involved in cell wall biosynthesis
VNRTFSDLDDFQGTYRSDALAAVFGELLDRVKPDLVHFHHTTCLSTTCVHETAGRNVPVAYTLHDFWLLCPRGQLLRRDLSLCKRNGSADCVRCMAYQLPVSGGRDRIQALDQRAEKLTRLRLPDELYRRIASFPFARERLALQEIHQRIAHVRETCARVDRFISPSHFLKQRYVRFGIPAEKIAVSDNGFDLRAWARHRRIPRNAGEPLRVAYIGTWIPSKGLHVLLEAFRDIDPAQARLELHGYAVPYDELDYEGLLRRLGEDLPHVSFRGRYLPQEVPTLLARADVVVVPSIWYENSPLTIHEAFLAGVPVVAADQGGMREFVRHGVNGLVFLPGDPRSLRASIERLAEDETLLERLRSAKVPVKGIEENAVELERLYRELAA